MRTRRKQRSRTTRISWECQCQAGGGALMKRRRKMTKKRKTKKKMKMMKKEAIIRLTHEDNQQLS